MVAQLEHVRVILSQDGDRVTLLPDDQPRLLLVCVAKVDSIKLKTGAIFRRGNKSVSGGRHRLWWAHYLKELVPVL